MYILLCGTPPFYAEAAADIFKLIKKGTVKFAEKEWKEISIHAKNLIKGLLTLNP